MYPISINQIQCKVGTVTKDLVDEYKKSLAEENKIYAKYLKDKEELQRKLEKGIYSAENEKLYDAEEVFKEAYELENKNLKE